jgi:hypothetical protein
MIPRFGKFGVRLLEAQGQAVRAACRCVKGGGGAIIVVDNDTFAGPGTDSVNQSFISSSGLHVTRTLTATQPATMSAPSNMSTDGPIGNVSCLVTF